MTKAFTNLNRPEYLALRQACKEWDESPRTQKILYDLMSMACAAEVEAATDRMVAYLKKQFDTIAFPSKEDDGIEHMDCSHKELYALLVKARKAGREE